MTRLQAGVIGLACIGLVGCPKKDTDDARGDATATASSVMSTDAGAGAGAGAGGDAAAASAKAGATFGGKYVLSAGTLYVPAEKDWASVKFKNDEAKMLGEGELALTTDATGRVSGTSEGGPLGAAIFDGSTDGQTLSATVRRKDPTDNGLTGTLVAKVNGEKLEGSMNLAEFNGAIVRVATFSATKK